MAYRSDRAAERLPLAPSRGRWLRHVVALVAVVAYVAAAIGGARALWQHREAARFEERGIASGPGSLVRGVALDPWAVNVALEQHGDEQALGRSLDLLVAGGFRTVRQRFPWADIEPARGEFHWEMWDAIVRQCDARQLRVIAVLDGSPTWARAPEDAANPVAPPRNPADLATFARFFAARYGSSIDHYQVWDDPNIAPHWGERDVDPAAYLGLLRAARTQILDVDPGATLVCGGLSPTTEERGRNMSELAFLRGLYGAGGRDLFDVVAVKPMGFWSGPEDREVGPGTLNFSRLVAVREEMVRQGDGQKPVWAVSWGWNVLPEGWAGRPSPWGSDAAWRQHDRDLRAIQRARQEWPWLGLMCYAAWQPAAPADDPLWGMGLVDAQGNPGSLYQRFQAAAQAPPVLYPGWHSVDPQAADVDGRLEIRFWGSAVGIEGPGEWQLVELDGRPLARTLRVADEPKAAVRGLPAMQHTLVLRPLRASGLVQMMVWRERPPLLPLQAVAAIAAAAVLATAIVWRLLRPYPWRRWAATGLGTYRSLGSWAALAAAAAALMLLALAPNLPLSFVALGLLALLIVARPAAGLGLAVLLVPMAPAMKRFGPARLSYLEIVTLLAIGGQFLHEVAAALRAGQPLLRRGYLRASAALRHVDALDLGFALLVGASFLSLAASENLRVSLRELRVVVLQALFLYVLVVRTRPDREGILQLTDLVVLSATVMALYGLYQYTLGGQVVVTEGVRRVRGIYGSPNNLALVLGRALPIMVAMALSAAQGWRRRLYAAASLPTGLGLFLTFSKGGLLFGVPASLLVLGLLSGRRTRVVLIVLAIVGLVGLVPLLGTARFGSLLSLQGTSLFRVKLWEAAWDMARDHPLLGVGLDNFLYQYPRYIRPEARSEPDLSHPHNVVLDFWLRLGLLGLVAFAWLVWHYFRRALALWRRRTDPALWALTAGLLAAMVDMLAHGLVDASFFVVELAGLFALMVGLVRRLDALAAEPASAAGRREEVLSDNRR